MCAGNPTPRPSACAVEGGRRGCTRWSFFGPLINEIVAVISRFDAADQATVERFLGDVHEAVTSQE